MFIPVAPHLSVTYLQGTIRTLEEDFDLTVRLLQVMAEQLRVAVGDQNLTPGMRNLLGAFDPARQAELAEQISRLVQKPEPTGPRELRDLLEFTWDEVRCLRQRWPSLPRSTRRRYVVRLLVRRLLRQHEAAAGPSA